MHNGGIYSPLLGDIPWHAIERIEIVKPDRGKARLSFLSPYIEAYFEDMHPVERFIRRMSVGQARLSLDFYLSPRNISLEEVEMIAKNLWQQSMERPRHPVS